MDTNYAANGIKRIIKRPVADIETLKIYRPDVLAAYVMLAHEMGENVNWIFQEHDSRILNEHISSGYRDMPHDPAVKYSPHYFGLALDIIVGGIMKQIEWGAVAIDSGYFNRVGFYPQQNTMHVDRCSVEWMEKYRGMPSWVKWNSQYTSFVDYKAAAKYALQLVDDDE